MYRQSLRLGPGDLAEVSKTMRSLVVSLSKRITSRCGK